MSVTSEKILKWVQLAIKHEDIVNPRIEVEGQPTKGEGHSGDMNFVRVSGTTTQGKPKTLNLVIKSSKTSKKFREKIPVKEPYAREILIYETVKPAFEQLLRESKVEEVLDFMPRCYATETAEDSEVLVLENLRPEGFQLWDKTRPVTQDHATLVLEAYGKWHALSMALKLRKPQVFEDLTRNNINILSNFLRRMKFDVCVVQEVENAKSSVVGALESGILEHLQWSSSDVSYALHDMHLEDPEYHVIMHGDCWNNNFLYKNSKDNARPSEVKVLDWQCAGPASVAFDLSYFIYSCVDTGTYDDVRETLKIYYSAFSKYLSLLGCDSQKVFSFDRLLEQWRKFSRFGLFLSCWVIRLCLMDHQGDLLDFGEAVDKDREFAENVTFQASSDDVFLQRVRNNFVHYAKSLQ